MASSLASGFSFQGPAIVVLGGSEGGLGFGAGRATGTVLGCESESEGGGASGPGAACAITRTGLTKNDAPRSAQPKHAAIFGAFTLLPLPVPYFLNSALRRPIKQDTATHLNRCSPAALRCSLGSAATGNHVLTYPSSQASAYSETHPCPRENPCSYNTGGSNRYRPAASSSRESAAKLPW